MTEGLAAGFFAELGVVARETTVALVRAASAAEANYQQVGETSRKLSAQLRGAEDRLRELEAQVRHYQDRADRAEKWLYQISVEIEQKFIGRDNAASV